MKYQFTTVKAYNTKLNKTFDTNGKKSSNAFLVHGAYQVYEVTSIQQLFAHFKSLDAHQAIIPSVPKNGIFNGSIYTSKLGITTEISRTKEDFSFNGNNILCFDYDPDLFGYKIDGPEHYVQVLRDIDPLLNDCQIGVTYGSSYGIHIDGRCINDKLSLHAYIFVSNATNEKVQTYKESFKNACWIKGYGHVKISSSGALLQRQVFDEVVFSPERLLFEAAPTLADGVTQIKPDDYITIELGSRDLNIIEPNDGSGKLLFEAEKRLKAPDSQTVRKEYINVKSDELVQTTNISKELAIQTITRKITDSVLMADDVLHSKDGIIKVADIFLNSEKYTELELLDPINPKTGQYVAKLYINETSLIVHSFKSGGVNYKLVANEKIIQTICDKAVSSGETENKKFVKWINALCTDAEVSPEFLLELARTLKDKKIIRNLKELKAKKIPISFPDVKYIGDEIRLLNTDANLETFLTYKGIEVKYDEILKEGKLYAQDDFMEFNKETDDKINSQFMKIKSETIRIGLPEKIIEYLPSIIDKNSYNPLMEMVTSKPWDGIDRITEVIACLKTSDSYEYVRSIVTLWFIQSVAAWDYVQSTSNKDALPRFESVLVFVGDQGLSKTKFFEGLLPKEFKRYMKAGVNLDVHNKDSVKIAIEAAITELGELDSTFLKDIGALKAFLSLDRDKMRLPYAKSESNFKRCTSFCASVNDFNFLVDPTGNRRFHPIHLTAILFNLFTKIDKQQLWAQVYELYISGEKWWIDRDLDKDLYAMLNKKHQAHMMISPVDDIIEKVIADTHEYEPDFSMHPVPMYYDDYGFVFKTATEIATHFRLQTSKRNTQSKIKTALQNAGIVQKGNTFRVRLAD